MLKIEDEKLIPIYAITNSVDKIRERNTYILTTRILKHCIVVV